MIVNTGVLESTAEGIVYGGSRRSQISQDTEQRVTPGARVFPPVVNETMERGCNK